MAWPHARGAARQVLRAPLERVGRGLEHSHLTAGVVLLYHAVRLDPLPISGFAPSISAELFRDHLEYLRSRYELVGVSALPQAARDRVPHARFPVAITFDDDLPEHVEHAVPLLKEFGIPATFFLSGNFLFEDRDAWWLRLEVANRAGLSRREIADLVRRSLPAGSAVPLDPARLAVYLEALPPKQLDVVEGVLQDATGDIELKRLTRDGAFEIAREFEVGFHTRRHRRLTDLPDDALRRSLNDGRAELEAALGQRFESIAYPHGRGDTRVARAARAAGFPHGLITGPDAVTPRTNPMLINRLPADDLSTGDLSGAISRRLARAAIKSLVSRTPAARMVAE